MKQLENWKGRVRYWRERLSDSEDYPILNSLENTWDVISDYYGRDVKRTDIEKSSNNPLISLFYFIEVGLYPPPELLLALLDLYQEYLDGKGKISLEDVFFGPPKKGVGNYAAREHSFHLYNQFSIEFMIFNDKKLSQIEFAEDYIRRHEIDIDAESFLRNWRRRDIWKNLRKK